MVMVIICGVRGRGGLNGGGGGRMVEGVKESGGAGCEDGSDGSDRDNRSGSNMS